MSRTLKFIKLFKMIFSKKERIDLVELESMGLLAVKIGQMYALRLDFLPKDKCEVLMALFERAQAAEVTDFQNMLKENASVEFWAAVESVDSEALAVASLGQVHRGVLKSGEEVAVKIVKGSFKRDFLKDVRALRRLLRGATFFHPALKKLADPEGTLNAIERQILAEIDLRNEWRGAEQWSVLRDAERGKRPYLSKLKFPKYYRELSNESLLVTEFLKYPSVGQLLEKREFLYDDLLDLFQIHGFFLFVLGCFHGDLHPGNVFFDEKKKQFYFIDNATIEQTSASFNQGVVRHLFELSKGRFEQAALVLHEVSERKLSASKLKKFTNDFKKLYANFSGKSVSEVSLTNQMMQTVKLAVHAGMSFPEGMFPMIKSLMYLDGMVLKANPEAILLEDVQAFESELTC